MIMEGRHRMYSEEMIGGKDESHDSHVKYEDGGVDVVGSEVE